MMATVRGREGRHLVAYGDAKVARRRRSLVWLWVIALALKLFLQYGHHVRSQYAHPAETLSEDRCAKLRAFVGKERHVGRIFDFRELLRRQRQV